MRSISTRRSAFYAALVLCAHSLLACAGDPRIELVPEAVVAHAFPVEVLGRAGTRVAVHMVVPSSMALRQSLALHIGADNVVAVDADFVSVNGGRAIDLATHGARRPFGGYARAVVELAPGDIHEGDNLITFTYARELRDISGFRILQIELVDMNDQSTRLALSLPFDEPRDFAPPSADSAVIALGARFFTVETRDGGPACARCHADDGADLAYFAFSNFSLQQRAEHHLFSADEASAIASYIRSLGVAPVGRPYDPPFQPGPTSNGAAGAGREAILESDADELIETFPDGVPSTLAWDVAAAMDSHRLRVASATPTWLRWLPRHIDEEWFTREEGRLARAKEMLDQSAELAVALEFQSAAIQIGKEILVENGDHDGRIELLRYAAVKLWDWQRRHGGFDGSDHGFPDGGPAFPYEVGFAFFEAALADAVPDAMAQAYSWWVAQVAVNSGRGQSNGERPLNWHDVLLAAESAGAGPAALTRLHLIGSYEESRGALADDFGTARGPVRLLAVPLRQVDAEMREILLTRFFVREAEFLQSATLDAEHHAELVDAWEGACAALSEEQRSRLRTTAPSEVRSDLEACP